MRIVQPVRRLGRSALAMTRRYAPEPESAGVGDGVGIGTLRLAFFELAGRSFGAAGFTESRPCTDPPSWIMIAPASMSPVTTAPFAKRIFLSYPLDTRRRGHVTVHRATDDHFAGGDVTNDRRARAEHDDVGVANRAFESAIDAQRSIGLDIAAHGELRVQHRVAGAGSGRSRRIGSALEQAHRRSRA